MNGGNGPTPVAPGPIHGNIDLDTISWFVEYGSTDMREAGPG
jgi:hypothetical protein